MNQLVRDLRNSYDFHHDAIAKLVTVERLLADTGMASLDDDSWGAGHYLGFSAYPEPTVSITPMDGDLGRVARLLLPKVGNFEKSFNEQTNTMKLTAEVNGIKIVISAAPPKTCTVEVVEEEVEVPEQVIPARVEKRKKYVLKGDCEPLLQAGQPA